MLKPEKLLLNPAQPRKNFDPASLASLAESLRENGMLQPLTVRRTAQGYVLISGERRLLAAKQIAMKKVPCMVVKCNEKTAAVMAMLENLQRENLDVFEEARGIERLMTHYGLSQEETAAHLGVALSTLSAKLQILELSPWQQERVRGAGLSLRQMKALVQIPQEDQRNDLLLKVIARQLTPLQTEQLVRSTLEENHKGTEQPRRKSIIGDVRLFANTLQNALSTMQRAGVQIKTETTETDRFIQYCIQIPKIREEFAETEQPTDPVA